MQRFRRRARYWCPRLAVAFFVGTAAVPGLGGALGAGTTTMVDAVPSATAGAFALGDLFIPPTTTTTTFPLAPPPAPAPAPARPRGSQRAQEPVVVLGSIEIPSLGVALPLHQGISLRVIDRGPSHWPGTA
ncbi:MAG: hypothetical protein M3O23_10195, partial [Actinomycetota bacterium]|nr:hypothetical protein [Actinomycetota bacterium]